MEIDPQRLPDNPVILRQMVLDLATQLEVHERRLARVQNLLEQLLRWRFGQKREKIDERQLFLFAVQLEASGGDVNELIAELEQEQQEQEQQAPTGRFRRAGSAGGGRGREPETARSRPAAAAADVAARADRIRVERGRAGVSGLRANDAADR